MTTVAWDGKRLAADSRATSDNEIVPITMQKIVRSPRGHLVSACGLLDRAMFKFFEWGEKGCKTVMPIPRDDETTFIVITPDAVIMEASKEGGVVLITPLYSFYAWGSGSPFALGALAAGKSAMQAVRIASKFDTNTNDNITVERLRRAA